MDLYIEYWTNGHTRVFVMLMFSRLKVLMHASCAIHKNTLINAISFFSFSKNVFIPRTFLFYHWVDQGLIYNWFHFEWVTFSQPSILWWYYLWGAIRFLCWFLFLLFWIAHFQKSFLFFFKICHYLLYNNFIVFMSVIILCCQHSWCYICLS